MLFTGITVLCQVYSNLSANASTRTNNESHLLSRGSHSIFLVRSDYSDINLEGRFLRWSCRRASASCFMCGGGGTRSSRPQRSLVIKLKDLASVEVNAASSLPPQARLHNQHRMIIYCFYWAPSSYFAFIGTIKFNKYHTLLYINPKKGSLVSFVPAQSTSVNPIVSVASSHGRSYWLLSWLL